MENLRPIKQCKPSPKYQNYGCWSPSTYGNRFLTVTMKPSREELKGLGSLKLFLEVQSVVCGREPIQCLRKNCRIREKWCSGRIWSVAYWQPIATWPLYALKPRIFATKSIYSFIGDLCIPKDPNEITIESKIYDSNSLMKIGFEIWWVRMW